MHLQDYVVVLMFGSAGMARGEVPGPGAFAAGTIGKQRLVLYCSFQFHMVLCAGTSSCRRLAT
jgi:hypothetical protein